MNRRIIAVMLIIIGLVLVVDEIWMLFPIGSPGWLIGDWSWMHVEPFHHWMLGVVSIVVGVRLIR